MKVLSIFGTRPEAIKMAPVLLALQQAGKGFSSRVCVTAQHREMLDQVLGLFNIKADYDLNLMQPGQNLFDLTSRLLTGLKEVIEKEGPDVVLVQGDTTTAMAGALAAFYQRTKVGHVEAGLRTRNKHAPFPEEINRRIAGVIADLHFAPTEAAAENLRNEGIPAETIFVTGNTVVDALLSVVEMFRRDANLNRTLQERFGFLDVRKKLVLVTGHRRESFGKGFESICSALLRLVERHPEVELIYPVHLNPNVQEPVRRILGKSARIHLIEPLDYLPFVYLLDRSYLIITDSGGVQEEAPSLGKPVLVMRETTERPEAVAVGTVKLVGTDAEKILFHASELLQNDHVYKNMSQAHNPYGDGKAAARIVQILRQSTLNGQRTQSAGREMSG